MSNFYETLQSVLLQCERLKAQDGSLLRNYAFELGYKMDEEILQLLYENKETRKHFFTKVGGLAVFDKTKFGWVVNNRQFLPDSYTRFSNKIGLTDHRDKFIAQTEDVCLSFPYKDCILEGGQTKDDQKRSEIFWNELLSPDECARLLEPKAFCNAKRFTEHGTETITELNDSDNLLIKGNNLLALASLVKVFAGKIKLIYIDPPYNTGNDSFQYNDRFNHASWLTFMKNRLVFAMSLLSNDGVIFVQCDDNEQAYLKVLMDEIFGRENFVSSLVWRRRGGRQDSKYIAQIHETILMFAKNIDTLKINQRNVADNSTYPFYDAKQNKKYKLQLVRKWGSGSRREDRPNLYYGVKFGKEFVYPLLPDGSDGRWRWSKKNLEQAIDEDRIVAQIKNGKTELYEKIFDTEGKKEIVYTSWIEDSFSGKEAAHLQELFNERVFECPKPEELIKYLIEIATQPGDIVLDFCAGSGTTLAVAHKMGRRWIGIEQMDYIETVTAERLKKVIGKMRKGGGGGRKDVRRTRLRSGRYFEGSQLAGRRFVRLLRVSRIERGSHFTDQQG